MKHSEQITYRTPAAYTEGEVTASEAASIEEALSTSDPSSTAVTETSITARGLWCSTAGV